MRVIFTPRAEGQLDRLHHEITQRSGYESRADDYIARIVAFCRKLDLFPKRGTQRDDIFTGLRLIGFERRVTVVFIVTKEAVLIEGIFYGGQDIAGFYVQE